MSVIDLFRKRAELLAGNPGNPNNSVRVTATGHGTQGGNPGNPGNPEINRNGLYIEERAAKPRKGGVYCYRVTDKPDSTLVMVSPESNLDEATETLRLKYGNRLMDVYPMPGTLH